MCFNAVLFLELARTAIIQHFRILYGDLHIIIFLQLGEDATEQENSRSNTDLPASADTHKKAERLFYISLIGTEEFILSQAGHGRSLS